MEYKEIQPLGLDEKYERFQDILSDEELKALFDKHGIRDERERKQPVYYFFQLMVLSAVEPESRGCILSLIGFFLGAISLLFFCEKNYKTVKNRCQLTSLQDQTVSLPRCLQSSAWQISGYSRVRLIKISETI
ncbi:hypothetical protein QUF75_20850 [Desulfococcaceae bacterium HSG7]|nr:hypothetical protein [Desulfococcaceae bacterium HSG7]